MVPEGESVAAKETPGAVLALNQQGCRACGRIIEGGELNLAQITNFQ